VNIILACHMADMWIVVVKYSLISEILRWKNIVRVRTTCPYSIEFCNEERYAFASNILIFRQYRLQEGEGGPMKCMELYEKKSDLCKNPELHGIRHMKFKLWHDKVNQRSCLYSHTECESNLELIHPFRRSEMDDKRQSQCSSLKNKMGNARTRQHCSAFA
jgi:hypothetical protein